MITYNLKQIIFELFQYSRLDKKDTEEFIKLKHNDKLCPIFQSKIESIAHSFNKYRNITYDMQGINDRGTDILLRVSDEDTTSYICFQIKSEDDLKDKYYLKILKSQYFDTKEKYDKLEDYYIILCCNTNNKINKDKIRNIEAEMSKHNDIQIIEPEFSLTFIKIRLTVIDALIKNKISDEDIVFKEALSIINDLTPTEMSILFYSLYLKLFKDKDFFMETDIINSSFINEIFNIIPNHDRDYFFYDKILDSNRDIDENEAIDYNMKYHTDARNLDIQTRISYDMNFLERTFLHCNYSGKYRILPEFVYPLIIILLDGYVRYGYKDNDLLKYMMSIRGNIKGLNLLNI